MALTVDLSYPFERPLADPEQPRRSSSEPRYGGLRRRSRSTSSPSTAEGELHRSRSALSFDLNRPSVSPASAAPSSRQPGVGRPPCTTAHQIIHRSEDCPLSDALTQRRRAAAGWVGLAGNHVMVEIRDGAVVAVCHLGAPAFRYGWASALAAVTR